METKVIQDSTKQRSPEELSIYIAPKIMTDLHRVESARGMMNHQFQPPKCSKECSAANIQYLLNNVDSIPAVHSPIRATEPCCSYSISISMPSSPSGFHIGQAAAISSNQTNEGKLHSQPILAGTSVETQERTARIESMKNKRYDSFKTWSGRLERQISNLRGVPQEPDVEADVLQITEAEPVPEVDRYFDALEGPELETLRASEGSVLPKDEKWPFLLRFPISTFGMCIGLSTQAILWKTLATSPSLSFLHVSLVVNLVLWYISVALMATVSLTYSLKLIFYFEAVRREYYHPVRVNFFFAPWITCLFLALGVPPSVTMSLNPALWYVLMAPIFCLDIKIYGQWMSRGNRRLSKVANPSNHLAITGNFVGALLGATIGLKEGPIFFFAVGLAHYLVLFVTLYQRLPTNEALPKELHPVYFLFVAVPSVACVAWEKISGDFDYGSKMAYFIALFLYISLAVRINFFRGFRFSLAWWAYTMPMSGAAIATIKYSIKVTSMFSQSLSIGLSAISAFTVMSLLVATIVHAFVLHDLFPNDVAIAITKKSPKLSKKHKKQRTLSSDTNDLEAPSPADSPQKL